jgi:hypothetical protein
LGEGWDSKELWKFVEKLNASRSKPTRGALGSKNVRWGAPVRENGSTESNKKKRQLRHPCTTQPARMGHPRKETRGKIKARPTRLGPCSLFLEWMFGDQAPKVIALL